MSHKNSFIHRSWIKCHKHPFLPSVQSAFSPTAVPKQNLALEIKPGNLANFEHEQQQEDFPDLQACLASPRLCKALLCHCQGSHALCQSQLAPHCPLNTACTQERQQALCNTTNSFPGISTAAATAFHFTPHFINHLPRVPAFQSILPRCLVAWMKSILCVYRAALPQLYPEVKDPFHGFLAFLPVGPRQRAEVLIAAHTSSGKTI